MPERMLQHIKDPTDLLRCSVFTWNCDLIVTSEWRSKLQNFARSRRFGTQHFLRALAFVLASLYVRCLHAHRNQAVVVLVVQNSRSQTGFMAHF